MTATANSIASPSRAGGDLEDDDRSADDHHGKRMSDSPDDADTGGRANAVLATQDSGDSNNVIGIGCMAHPEY